MPGKLLNTNSSLQCPHGGAVQAATSNSTCQADGAFVLVLSDVLSVSDCPFQIPAPSGTVPSPCITVQWILGELLVTVSGTPVLSESSVGLCISDKGIPQGAVTVVGTQGLVSA